MTSKIILYKNSHIEYGKNFIVDDISTYLSTLTKTELTSVQAQKIQKSMNLKLNLSQYGLDMNSSNNYNYLSISNYDDSLKSYGKTYYFFIIDKVWKAQSTLNLVLEMDTVNTFKPTTDFTFNAKTHIHRQHKNRFSKANYSIQRTITGTLDYDPFQSDYRYELTEDFQYGNLSAISIVSSSPASVTASVERTGNRWSLLVTGASDIDFTVVISFTYVGYRRVIDEFSEGLTPILYKQQEHYITTPDSTSWNLVYINNDDIEPTEYNQVNPINCFLCPDEDMKIKVQASGSKILPANLGSGHYVVAPNNNNILTDDWDFLGLRISGVLYSMDLTWVSNNRYQSYFFDIQKHTVGGIDYIQVDIYRIIYSYSGGIYTEWSRYLVDQITQLSEIGIEYISSDRLNYSNTLSNLNLVSGYFTLSGYTNTVLAGINSVDRSDSKIVKIIKLPYCPANLVYNTDNSITFSSEWEFDSGTKFMKLKDLNSSFYSEIEFDQNPLDILKGFPMTPSIDDLRITLFDPKLYHSDYYQCKEVYDSFVYPIHLENIDTEYMKDSDKFKVNFIASNTVNSRFLFDFKSIDYKRTTLDYPNILNIARNNEMTVFSNQFLNYLRTGYNYDVKSKERQELSTYLGLGTSVVGGIASVGLGLASGNPAVAVSSVISTANSMTNTIVGSINSIAQREADMEQKMAQLKAQSVSVSGADDLDLLVYYSRNKMKQVIYKASNTLLNAIDDLFFYSGYATDKLGTPDMTSRKWFNFVSCDLVINSVSYIPAEIEADIVTKYSEGITFLHKNNNAYDFSQSKENWEVSLL